MTRFLYGWDRHWRDYEAAGMEGQPFDHAASGQFRSRGVLPGDVVYVAAARDQKMVLVGRLPVSEVLDRHVAEARLDRDLIDRPDHVLAAEPDSTISFTRVVPEQVARSLRSERGAGIPFENDDEYRLHNQALRPMIRLTPESAAALDRLLDEAPPEDPTIGRFAGRRNSGAARDAVEQRAVEVVTEALEADGWTVRDVGATESFDLDCSRRDELLHVEVKGTVTAGERVTLTANEVDHARLYPHVALGIVRHIALDQDDEGNPRANGGELVYFDPWAIDDGTLRATEYAYEPPYE